MKLNKRSSNSGVTRRRLLSIKNPLAPLKLEGDILALFHEMYEGKLSTNPIDYSFICFIPKKEGAERANDYRPISLLNGIQKILLKVLANRLEPIMNDLIFSS